jgi:hypothetical protein
MSADRTLDLHDVTERWAHSDIARDAARILDRRVPGTLRRGPVAATLRGRGFGHALHPVLTDIPLGMWMAATVLDVVGLGRWRRASLLLTPRPDSSRRSPRSRQGWPSGRASPTRTAAPPRCTRRSTAWRPRCSPHPRWRRPGTGQVSARC